MLPAGLRASARHASFPRYLHVAAWIRLVARVNRKEQPKLQVRVTGTQDNVNHVVSRMSEIQG